MNFKVDMKKRILLVFLMIGLLFLSFWTICLINIYRIKGISEERNKHLVENYEKNLSSQSASDDNNLADYEQQKNTMLIIMIVSVLIAIFLILLVFLLIKCFVPLVPVSEAEEKYRLLTDMLPEWIWELDLQGRFLYSSFRVYKLLGYFPDDLIGTNMHDLFTNGNREYLLQEQAKFRDDPHKIELEGVNISNKAGDFKVIQIIMNPIFDKEQNLIRIAGVCKDMTEIVKLKEDNKSLIQQLNQSQKLEAIGTLAGGIAHDFNNLLSAILGYSEISMLKLAKDSPFYFNFDCIKKACARAADLVRQILNFSRKTDDTMSIVQIQYPIKEALKLLKEAIPSTIEIKHKIDNNCKPAITSATQIFQIITNLCTNAFHAIGKNGGTIEVSLRETELPANIKEKNPEMNAKSYLELRVKDSGSGIPPEILTKIFDPFFTTKAEGVGTGLGLSNIANIVKLCHGHILVESEIGKGTTFIIYLPTVENEVTQTIPEDAQCGLIKGKGHVLFVDDEEMILSVARHCITQSGYTFDGLKEPEKAYELFLQNPGKYDLAIVDFTMPKIPGMKFIQLIRAVKPDLPVILCSGFENDLEQELVDNNILFMKKPFSINLLLSMVRQNISQ